MSLQKKQTLWTKVLCRTHSSFFSSAQHREWRAMRSSSLGSAFVWSARDRNGGVLDSIIPTAVDTSESCDPDVHSRGSRKEDLSKSKSTSRPHAS